MSVVEQHGPVHLPRQADRPNPSQGPGGLSSQLSDRLLDGPPPILRILLGPERLWSGHPQICARFIEDDLALVGQNGFDRGGPDVDSEKGCHERASFDV